MQNLLLVDPGDVPELKRILAGWREEREAVQAAFEGERRDTADPPELDTDAVLAELEHLEDSLTAESVDVANAAFGRVFKSISLFWKQVSPRRLELVRAQIATHFPFV